MRALSQLGPARCVVGGIKTGGETDRFRLSRAMFRLMTSTIRMAPPGRAAATRSATRSWSPWSSPSESPSGSFLSIFIWPASLKRLVTGACLLANRFSGCRIITSAPGSGWSASRWSSAARSRRQIALVFGFGRLSGRSAGRCLLLSYGQSPRFSCSMVYT